MKVLIASDHGGYTLKSHLISTLKDIIFTDLGCENDKESVDYPDYSSRLCKQLLEDPKAFDFGILICGTGIGISIAANRHKGIRAALCHNEFTARMSRQHNNANVLALGARVLGSDLAVSIVKEFMTATFEGGRHQRRVEKIDEKL